MTTTWYYANVVHAQAVTGRSKVVKLTFSSPFFFRTTQQTGGRPETDTHRWTRCQAAFEKDVFEAAASCCEPSLDLMMGCSAVNASVLTKRPCSSSLLFHSASSGVALLVQTYAYAYTHTYVRLGARVLPVISTIAIAAAQLSTSYRRLVGRLHGQAWAFPPMRRPAVGALDLTSVNIALPVQRWRWTAQLYLQC